MITQSDCTVVIYNKDNKFINENISSSQNESKTYYSFGQQRSNFISYHTYKITEKGTEIVLHIEGDIVKLLFPYFLPQEYQEVFSAAIAVALKTPFSQKDNNHQRLLSQIKESLVKNFKLPKGRGSYLSGINKSILIDSSYNASKVSVISSLEMIDKLHKSTKRPVVVVFGDMRELGFEAKIEHFAVAQQISEVADYLYCTGPLTQELLIPHIKSQRVKEMKWFRTNIELGKYLRSSLPTNALVLVKGSQNTIFLEESIKYILENPSDSDHLCRQEKYWLNIKKAQDKLAKV